MPEPKPGDKVSIKTEKEEFEGILMPRPEILDKDITVLKLDNGYNIGIDSKKIKEIKVIEQYKKKAETKKESKTNKSLPTVSILSAGGTISSKVDYKTGGVIADYTAEDFLEMLPELKDIANIRAKNIASLMSEDMTSDDWRMIAEAVEKEINDEKVDGVIVTQGTDTLHFTAAALSFMLKNITKPIIITASQRSIDRGSSDAFMNLSCAIRAAAKSDIAEVMTCLHNSTNDDFCLLLKGAKVRKMHSSRRDAFRPINSVPIAKVYENGKIDITDPYYNKRKEGKIELETKFEKKVGILYTYPGIDPKLLDSFKDYKGIVIAGTGLGNIPQSMFKKVEDLIKDGVAVVITTQTIYGSTHPLVYQNLRMLSIKMDCIFVQDMLPETAYVKLGWVLSKTKKLDEVRELMQKNIAGEISERNTDESFLY